MEGKTPLCGWCGIHSVLLCATGIGAHRCGRSTAPHSRGHPVNRPPCQLQGSQSLVPYNLLHARSS
eukprot:1652213-Rhodomonas_salina.1